VADLGIVSITSVNIYISSYYQYDIQSIEHILLRIGIRYIKYNHCSADHDIYIHTLLNIHNID